MALISTEISEPKKSLHTFILTLILFVISHTAFEVQGKQSARKIQLSTDDPDTIEIRSPIDFETCKKQCSASSECIFVNYHSSQRMCYKVFKLGTEKTYYAEKVRGHPGYFCWEKDETKRKTMVSTTTITGTTIESTTTMPEQSTTTTIPNLFKTKPTQSTTRSPSISPGSTTSLRPSSDVSTETDHTLTSPIEGYGTSSKTPPHMGMVETTAESLCDTNPEHEYCVAFCRPPEKFQSISHKGNMFTAGSRQVYLCYNQTTQKPYKQILVCTEDGIWVKGDNVCSYQYPVQVEKYQMMYKFVNVKSTQEAAYKNCLKENATLVTLKYKSVPSTLRRHFDKYKGVYWTDSNRKSFGNWFTTDGVRVPAGLDIWLGFHASSWRNLFDPNPDKCASMECSYHIRQRDCSGTIPFICEMVM